jgi:hypothetical protein
MGKYIIYGLIILFVLFILEWLQIVDIPFLEIPDYFSGKEKLVNKTSEAID